MISLESSIPLLVFLVIAFLVFYFVETIMILALNHYIRKHWKFVVDKLLRTVVRHRTMMRIAAFGAISLITVLLFVFTSLADLLVEGVRAGVLRFLAVVLIITMMMIYYIGVQSLKEVVIVKRIHLFIFIILSLFTFTGVMATAHNGYAIYEEVINAAFVKPIVQDIESKYEKRMEERLVEIFREDIKNGECEYYDYAEKTAYGLTQFAFIQHDPALADENPVIKNKGEPLAGKNCIHQTKFLLTPEGKWYEVLEQDLESPSN